MNGAALSRWWQRLAPRERGLLAAGAVVLVAALVYLFLWEPPAQGIRRLQADLPQLRAQQATLRSMADEAARLRAAGGAAAALPPTDRLAAVRRSLERAGLWRDGPASAAPDTASTSVSALTVNGTVAVASTAITRTPPPEIVAEANDRVRVRVDNIDYGVWIAWLATTEGELAAHASRVSVLALSPKAPVGHVKAEVLLDWSQPAAAASPSSTPSAS